MSDFLDFLPLIFYSIAGAFGILYSVLYGICKFNITEKKNMIFMSLVLLFGILTIISAIVFWIYI